MDEQLKNIGLLLCSESEEIAEMGKRLLMGMGMFTPSIIRKCFELNDVDEFYKSNHDSPDGDYYFAFLKLQRFTVRIFYFPNAPNILCKP